MCKTFGTFTKTALIKNTDIYIFANLSAILKLCKLDNHPMKTCLYGNKCDFENV